MFNISGVPVSGLGEQRVGFRARLCSQGALSSNSRSAISKLCRLGQVTNLSEPVSSSVKWGPSVRHRKELGMLAWGTWLSNSSQLCSCPPHSQGRS